MHFFLYIKKFVFLQLGKISGCVLNMQNTLNILSKWWVQSFFLSFFVLVQSLGIFSYFSAEKQELIKVLKPF